MSFTQRFEVSAVDETPRWDLAPSPARVDRVDHDLRARLIDSLRYLTEFATLDDGRRAAFADVEVRLASGPVSPWVFGLYAKLVATLSTEPRGDADSDFDAIVEAVSPSRRSGRSCLAGSSSPDRMVGPLPAPVRH